MVEEPTVVVGLLAVVHAAHATTVEVAQGRGRLAGVAQVGQRRTAPADGPPVAAHRHRQRHRRGNARGDEHHDHHVVGHDGVERASPRCRPKATSAPWATVTPTTKAATPRATAAAVTTPLRRKARASGAGQA